MSSSAQGLLYCVSGYDDYLLECIGSIQSAREYCPHLAICVVSDLEEGTDTLKRYADELILMEPPDEWFVPWGAGLLQKIKALQKSPFERTLYLDTDTRILSSDVERIFEKLEYADIAMIEATPSQSVSRKLYGRFMYNTGVVAFRNTRPVKELLTAWEVLHVRHLRAIREGREDSFPYVSHLTSIRDKQDLLQNDQLALALLCPHEGKGEVRVEVLAPLWNWRPNELPKRRGVYIHHARIYKKKRWAK